MSVSTWVALLRGINVGRAKRVSMTDLRALLEGLGYDDVRTVLQSGNAVFATSGTRGAIQTRVKEAIATDLGLDVAVVAVSAQELAAVVGANPFLAKKADPKELHVSFLSVPPPAKKLAALDPTEFRPDEFAAGKRVIYSRQPNGVMGSRLPDWQKLFGLTVTVTARNWNTVTRIHAVAGG